MTSSTQHSATATTAGAASAPSRTPLLVALGMAAAVVTTAVGTFLDLTGNEPSKSNSTGELLSWLAVVAIAGIAAAVAFGIVVKGAATGNAGRRSLVTAIVGFLTLAVFWTGIPSVLVAASVGCALIDRDRHGSFNGLSKAGLGVSAVVAAIAVFGAVAG